MKKLSISAALTAVAVIVFGALSWATATGHAVIGPTPSSLAAERQTILWQTFCWSTMLGGTALLLWLFVKGNRHG